MPEPHLPLPDIDPAEVVEEVKEESEDALATSVEALQATGADRHAASW